MLVPAIYVFYSAPLLGVCYLWDCSGKNVCFYLDMKHDEIKASTRNSWGYLTDSHHTTLTQHQVDSE